MEELKQTFDKVVRSILGEKAVKYEIRKAVMDFFREKGIQTELFDVDVKRKYVYIRVDNPYLRNEMYMQRVNLEAFLHKRCPESVEFEVKFTGRR